MNAMVDAAVTTAADAAAALDAPTRARLAAVCLAIDPGGLGGAVLRAPRSDISEDWLAALRALLPEQTPWRRVPLGIPDDRLLGGLDLAMTLAMGRPVEERGLLASADGGVLVLPCAERATGGLLARLTQVLDTGAVPSRVPGSRGVHAARVAVVAIDESDEEDAPGIADALRDRLAFWLELPAGDAMLAGDALPAFEIGADDIARLRAAFAHVAVPDAIIRSAVALAAAFGIPSLRAVTHAVRVSGILAALHDRASICDEDLAAAAVLVFAPRATRRPAAAEPEPEAVPDEPHPPPESSAEQDDAPPPDENTQREMEEMLIRAVAAMLPPDLLDAAAPTRMRGGSAGGRAGPEQGGGLRGRQVGTTRGDPRAGGRLDLIETLRAAAPWQRLRAESESPERRAASAKVRVRVRANDFRLRRLIEPAGTTVLFAVDASGSAALHRMAEAKGAVELLLAESYARRDEVGLIAFRGTVADVLLSPTRAIAAAKRALAALPGGGGTPLASAIDRARDLALQARRTGNHVVVVFLTDARANIARDGTPGRPQAELDAHASAKLLRAVGATVLLIDTSPRPSEQAQRMAESMGARCVALPRSDAAGIHAAVNAAHPRSAA